MTPTKTLYLTEIGDNKYIVNEDGSLLTVPDSGQTFIFEQDAGTTNFLLVYASNLQIDNIETIQASDDLVTFEFGGYRFEYSEPDGEYTLSELPPEFAGTGKLVSHNFGVDEVFLCDKSNNVVWGRIGGQKMYFEQSAIGQFSTASGKPQTAAEVGAPAFEASQNTSFMLAGYVFINEEANSYASSPVPPTR